MPSSNCTITSILWANQTNIILGTTHREHSKLTKEIHLLLVGENQTTVIRSFLINYTNVSKVAVSANMQYIALGFKDGCIILFDMQHSKPEFLEVLAVREACTTLKFINENSFVSVCDKSGTIICWEIKNNKLNLIWKFIQESPFPLLQNYALSFHPDCILFKTKTAATNQLVALSLQTGTIIETVDFPNFPICSMTSIDGERGVLCGGEDELRVAIYNIRSKSLESQRYSEQLFDQGQPTLLHVLSSSVFLISDGVAAYVIDIDKEQLFPINQEKLQQFIPLTDGNIFILQKDGHHEVINLVNNPALQAENYQKARLHC